MIKFITRFLMLLHFTSALIPLTAQDNVEFSGKYQDFPYEANKVKEVKMYLTYPEDSTQHNLITDEVFNARGFLTKRKSFNESGEITSVNIYRYSHDTLLLSDQIEYPKTNIIYKTEKIYDGKGLLVKSTTKEKDKLLSTRKYKWNRKGTKLKALTDFGDSKTGTESRYDDEGRIISFKRVGKRKSYDIIERYEFNYLADGTEVQKYFFDNDSDSHILIETNKDLSKKTTNHSSRSWDVLGQGKKIILESGDESTKVHAYLENGLISSTSRYFNKQIVCIITYKYEYYP